MHGQHQPRLNRDAHYVSRKRKPSARLTPDQLRPWRFQESKIVMPHIIAYDPPPYAVAPSAGTVPSPDSD
ncbi:MAG TPA: hypothetical protein VEK08_26940 [Planctomycetota bacterium]|nr:hypothetical protein [Planctomycetota bacterium]